MRSAGLSAGAVGIGSALGAPVFGALADRLGQRPVLLFAAVFNTVAVIALILAAYLIPGGQDWPPPSPCWPPPSWPVRAARRWAPWPGSAGWP